MRRSHRLDDFFIGSAVRDDALALPALMRSCVALAAIVVALLIIIGLVFALWGTHVWNRNREALHGQLAQVQPLLAALEAYHQDYAAYPSTLHALVPKYLPKVPAPPFSFQAEWWYSPYPGDLLRWGEPSNPANAGVQVPEDTYHLWVWVPTEFTPLRGLYRDALVYRPNRQYPTYGYGGTLEPIGDWGYYHE